MKKESLELLHKKNILVSGDIAVGKTFNEGFPLVKDIINREESLFILDNRQEYLECFYDDLKKKDYNVIIINLDDCSKSDGWNALSYPYYLYKNNMKDAALDNLEILSKTLFYDKSESDSFWSLTAADYFVAATLALFEEGETDEINLASVARIIDSTNQMIGKKDYVRLYFERKGESHPGYRYACATIFAPMETKGGIIAVARQKIRALTSRESLTKLMAKTTFNLDDLHKKKTCIFVIGGKYKDLTSVFIEQLYMVVKNKEKQQFNFVIDNYDWLNYVSSLKDMLSDSLAYALRFIIITRDINKIYNDFSSYIEKLVTNINVLELSIDEERVYKSNIKYPHLETKYQIFDFEKLILSMGNQAQEIEVDELLKKIDTKIAEIDKEMKDEKEVE